MKRFQRPSRSCPADGSAVCRMRRLRRMSERERGSSTRRPNTVVRPSRRVSIGGIDDVSASGIVTPVPRRGPTSHCDWITYRPIVADVGKKTPDDHDRDFSSRTNLSASSASLRRRRASSATTSLLPLREQRRHDLLSCVIQGARHRAAFLGDHGVLDSSIVLVGLSNDETHFLSFVTCRLTVV